MSRTRRLAAALGLAATLCIAVLWVSLSSASAASSSGTKTFSFTGGEQAFSVPDGVTGLDVTAVGGKGGVGVTTGSVNPSGGFGAVATGKIAVTPGQILFIEVGGNGGSPNIQSGGFNGGGSGGGPEGGGIPGGGGGGGTDIRTISIAAAGNSLDSRLLIAGGGGGGGSDGFLNSGGAGGQAGLPALNGNGSDGNGGSSVAGAHGGPGGRGGTQVQGQGFELGGPGRGGNGSTIDDPYSGDGGGGGSGFFGGSGGVSGFPPQPQTVPPAGGGGGGGGGGSCHFASTATDTSVQTDATGVPLLRVTYKLGGNASGLKFGKVKLNKKKGTATLPVTVPGSGNLSIGGAGVVKKRPVLSGSARRLAKAVTAAGTYKLTVKVKGPKKHELTSTGKVKVKAVVTFKPTSGAAVHDSRKITLKKS